MRELDGHEGLFVAVGAVAIAWPLEVEEDGGWVCKLT
jgi:hypothetical protein